MEYIFLGGETDRKHSSECVCNISHAINAKKMLRKAKQEQELQEVLRQERPP